MEGGLSNIFLNNYIRPICKNFIGVFSVDDLPSNPFTLPCCLIANLSNLSNFLIYIRKQKGSHFIAMYINKKINSIILILLGFYHQYGTNV